MCTHETEVRIARLQLEPGDTLVVSTEHMLNRAQQEHLYLHIKRALPAGVTVLLLDARATLSVVPPPKVVGVA